MDLTRKTCVPCDVDTPPLSKERAKELARELPAWTLEQAKPRLRRDYAFPDFAAAMHFVNDVAAVAEQEGHHPDIEIRYDRVKLVLWTHAIGGLSENDFIVAAKIDALETARATP